MNVHSKKDIVKLISEYKEKFLQNVNEGISDKRQKSALGKTRAYFVPQYNKLHEINLDVNPWFYAKIPKEKYNRFYYVNVSNGNIGDIIIKNKVYEKYFANEKDTEIGSIPLEKHKTLRDIEKNIENEPIDTNKKYFDTLPDSEKVKYVNARTIVPFEWGEDTQNETSSLFKDESLRIGNDTPPMYILSDKRGLVKFEEFNYDEREKSLEKTGFVMHNFMPTIQGGSGERRTRTIGQGTEKQKISYGASSLKPFRRVKDTDTTYVRTPEGNYEIEKYGHENERTAYFLKGTTITDDTPPDYFTYNPYKGDAENAEEFVIIHVQNEFTGDESQGNEYNEKVIKYFEKNKELLDKIQRYHGANILVKFKKRARGVHIQKSPIPKSDAPEEWMGYATYIGPGERYKNYIQNHEKIYSNVDKITPIIKKSVGQMNKLAFYETLSDNIDEISDLLRQRSISPIIIENGFINDKIKNGFDDNGNIVLSGHSYTGYDSMMDLFNKIYVREKNKNFDAAQGTTIGVAKYNISPEGKKSKKIIEQNAIDLRNIQIGDFVVIYSDVDFLTPRKENAVLYLQSADNRRKTKTNYIVGELFEYNNKKKRLTVKVLEKNGNASVTDWFINYLRAYEYNIASRYPESRGGEPEYRGQTQAYGLDKQGFIKPNPETSLKTEWVISGKNMGENYKWTISLTTKMGQKLTLSQENTDELIGQIIDNSQKNMVAAALPELRNDLTYLNSEPNNNSISAEKIVPITNSEYIGNYLCGRDVYTIDDKKYEKNSIITEEEFNNIKDEHKKYCSKYTYMNDFSVKNGLVDLLKEFAEKIKEIDVTHALNWINLDLVYLSNKNDDDDEINELEESKIIVNNILNEIKRLYR